MSEFEQQHLGLVLHETYRLERLLGSGGMGAVYEASHTRLPRRFAVKLMFAALRTKPSAMERFFREATYTSQLRHPNIVKVMDYNHTDMGEPYMVMELLRGENLRTRLRRVAQLSLDQASSVLVQATSALEAAHAKGIVHRDLKPANIFLCQGGEDRELVKIVDFGIAKILGSGQQLTRTDSVIGTPWYLSPERIIGDKEREGPCSDIFSMGAIMYEMISGDAPFEGQPHEALFHIVYNPHPPLRDRCPGLPQRVCEAIDRAMCKEPGDRFPSMQEFCSAFCGVGGAARAGDTRARRPAAVEHRLEPQATAVTGEPWWIGEDQSWETMEMSPAPHDPEPDPQRQEQWPSGERYLTSDNSGVRQEAVTVKHRRITVMPGERTDVLPVAELRREADAMEDRETMLISRAVQTPLTRSRTDVIPVSVVRQPADVSDEPEQEARTMEIEWSSLARGQVPAHAGRPSGPRDGGDSEQ